MRVYVTTNKVSNNNITDCRVSLTKISKRIQINSTRVFF